MESATAPLPRLDNATLGDRASAALLDFIRVQKLRPGAVLPSEVKLAERLGVSRPVVREALRSLSGRGVVEIVNGRGAVVRELGPEPLEAFFGHALQTIDNSIAELMELRLGLECEAARLAARRRSDGQAERLQGLLAEMEEAASEPSRYSALDAELHVAIAQASGNRLYAHMIGSIRTAMRNASLAGMTMRLERGETRAVQAMHAAIVDAIVAHDEAAAEAAMRRHMLSAARAFQDHRPADPSDP